METQKISFYFDEMMRRAVAKALQEREIDVVMTIDVGMTGKSDPEHLQFATERGSIMVTRVLMILSFFLTLAGFVGGNSCPAWRPEEIEKWGQFHLPPSVRNLESYCAGMQGWIARARFEMSPDDLETFIASTSIKTPLSATLNPAHHWADDEIFAQMSTYLYGEADYGWQQVLIDTSDSSRYVVYFQAMDGN